MSFEARALACSRGQRLLFDELGFMLHAGQAMWVVGRNGEGKTSLLRILAGLAEPDAGNLFWEGEPLQSARTRFRGELVYVGHRDGLKDALSAEENLREWMALTGLDAGDDWIRAALQQVGLEHLARQAVHTLSQGQHRRVALARLALAESRRLWILDEPLNALDASGQEQVLALLDRHLEGGGMLIYTSHERLRLRAAEHARLSLHAESAC